jgi:hypothetical protein
MLVTVIDFLLQDCLLLNSDRTSSQKESTSTVDLISKGKHLSNGYQAANNNQFTEHAG